MSSPFKYIYVTQLYDYPFRRYRHHIGLWDQLLPPHQRLITSLSSAPQHQHRSLLYSTQYQMLISGDDHGHLHIWDLRQTRRHPLLTIPRAHEAPIDSIAFGSSSLDFRVCTGATNGEIKIWNSSLLFQQHQEIIDSSSSSSNRVCEPLVAEMPNGPTRGHDVSPSIITYTNTRMKILSALGVFYSCGPSGKVMALYSNDIDDHP